METIDITKAIENAVAKYLDAKFAEETKPMQFITTAKTSTKSKSSAKPKASQALKGQQVLLVPAIEEHYADFDNSALRAKALKMFNKATLRACVLAFASANKFSELDAWATKLKNKALQAWWKKQS